MALSKQKQQRRRQSRQGNEKRGSSMQLRRENFFAALIGHRILCNLKDGGTVSGIFSVYGNGVVLPSSWVDLSEYQVAMTEPAVFKAHAYVPCGDIEAEDGGWKTVSSQRKRKPALSTSGSGPGKSCIVSYSKDRMHDTPCLWVRCAYKVASTESRSSAVLDWLAIPWDFVVSVTVTGVGDIQEANSEAAPQPTVVQYGTATTFATDGDIAGNENEGVFERPLQRWGEGQETMEEVCSWNGPKVGESTTWDQFTENERTFGVKTTYVEGMYTTNLDMEAIPEDYRREAERLAEEIEVGVGRNRRWARSDDEFDDDDDEEAKFSAVVGTGRYQRLNLKGGRVNLVNGNTRRMKQRAPPPPPPSQGKISEIMRSPEQPDQRTMDLRQMDPARTIDPARSIDPVRAADGGRGVEGRHRHVAENPQQHHGAPFQLQRNNGLLHQDQGPSTIPRVDSHRRLQATKKTDEVTRVIKDNINALNLEPTRSKVAQVNSTQRHHRALLVRQNMKEILLEQSREIEKKLQQKGWTSQAKTVTDDSCSATAIATATAPTPTPTLSAEDGRSANTLGVTTTTTEVDTAKHISFQFNPNANSFTPKGGFAQTESGSAEHKSRFEPFDRSLAEQRKRAMIDRRSDLVNPPVFIQKFLSKMHQNVSQENPSRVSPEWRSNTYSSYIDFLGPTPMEANQHFAPMIMPTTFAPYAPRPQPMPGYPFITATGHIATGQPQATWTVPWGFV